MIRHMRRLWLNLPMYRLPRISRWVECGGGWVAWELHTAPRFDCPDCDGEGGWWTGGPDGDEPDMVACGRCSEPLVAVRIPAWLDRMIPRSPTRVPDGYWDDPPF
ncbi:hypothetical protein NG2371_07160 [Nocardia gamkensis]|nr:hypothetical protein [Nocardia gamkensis]